MYQQKKQVGTGTHTLAGIPEISLDAESQFKVKKKHAYYQESGLRLCSIFTSFASQFEYMTF